VTAIAPPLAAGTRLGPYEIVELIGSGGMADVYRGHDTRLNRAVAIKVLGAQLADTPQRRQRFEREARAISTLSHPNICVLYDVGEQDGRPFLVMEYVAGETLAQRLRRGPLPIADALSLAFVIADALDHAHRQGVIHRDLKPANVMLASGGVKLVDFGLAKLRELDADGARRPSDDTESLTQDGMLLGTLPYMAPERIEAKQADARSDIFAFGAVLYEMVTTRRAFDADTKASLLVSILEHEPRSLTADTRARGSEPGLLLTLVEHVVARCLAKQPDERWQTAADLKRELRWISSSAWPAEAAARGPRRRARTWAVAALVLGFAAVAGWSWLTWRSARLGSTGDPPVAVTFPVAPPPGTAFMSGPAAPEEAVSPDGNWIAFAAGESTVSSSLWLWSVRDGLARRLPKTDHAHYPFWRPDSLEVGFFADGRLKVVDIDGTAPLDLAAAAEADGGAWSADGAIVFAPTQSGGLLRVSAAGGGEVSPVTRLDETRHEVRHGWPAFLPDGRHFLFFAKSREADRTGIYVGSLDGEAPVFLLASAVRAAYTRGCLIFGREGTLFAQPLDPRKRTLSGDPTPIATGVAFNTGNGRMAFSIGDSMLVYRTGGSGGSSPEQLEWRDRTGRLITALGKPGVYGAIAESPDGRWVALQRGEGFATTLWLWDVTGANPRELADHVFGLSNVVWLRDSASIAYATAAGIVRLDLRDPASPHLVQGVSNANLTGWSPDGRTLLYGIIDPHTGWDIQQATIGDAQPREYVATQRAGQAQFSIDGRWIAYTSSETGRKEVWVGAFPSSPDVRFRISDGGGYSPLWRADGRALYYLDATNHLIEVDVRLETTFGYGPSRSLFPVFVEEGLAEHHVGQYAVSPDGQRFLIKTAAAPDSPLKVVLHWPLPASLDRPRR